MTGLQVHHPTSGPRPQRPAGSPTCAGLGGPGAGRDDARRRLRSWIQPTRPSPVGPAPDRSCHGAPGAGYRPGLSDPRDQAPATCSLGLRLGRQPPRVAGSGDQPPDRPAGRGIVAAARPGAVEGRADDRLDTWLPEAAAALRAQRCPLLRLRAAGLLTAQLPRPSATVVVILKCPLNEVRPLPRLFMHHRYAPFDRVPGRGWAAE